MEAVEDEIASVNTHITLIAGRRDDESPSVTLHTAVAEEMYTAYEVTIGPHSG